ncbi:unnamed protein product [Didymodactylos carnosus]|uniref:Tetratricopeptide repeat protein 38 n=1 Tax=Didymodactylos carnosus TaxID=1234261 RepID=A0A815DW65_9BILA|nr:unnamed protein product [Didymodactylos carnosus]CAF1364673.1 unnamed protein product [Didymodactylos carnosus]CAF4140792.1 unnamed protein product [Didymodactylos carnosus]CAF4174216.1 unnamed protein product [Didymodactylos carnosus]
MPFRSQWRDLSQLHSDGIPLDAVSNETAKLFDAALSQYIGWYNEPQLNGLENTFEKLFESDPNCVLSQVFSVGVELLSTSVPYRNSSSSKLAHLNQTFEKKLSETNDKNYLTLHVKAINEWAQGSLSHAANTWEQLLLYYPHDILAIKMAHDTYFFNGNKEMIRDSIARLIPIWESKSTPLPLSSYLYGMHAFGLGENNMLDEAQQQARKGLELNENDAWATHAIAHSYEYRGNTCSGIEFMSSTEHDWSKCEWLSKHNYWHWALYQFEQGDYEIASNILFKKILGNNNSELMMLDFVDIGSLFYRLKLCGVDCENKLLENKSVDKFIKHHLDDHLLVFNDLHLYFLLQNSSDEKTKFLKSLKETIGDNGFDNNENRRIYETVGKHMFQALDYFELDQHDRVVECLYPIRQQIMNIGGSNAQRDVFTLLLIHSAVHSPEKQHRLLAQRLLNERSQLRGNTSNLMKHYTDKLIGD